MASSASSSYLVVWTHIVADVRNPSHMYTIEDSSLNVITKQQVSIDTGRQHQFPHGEVLLQLSAGLGILMHSIKNHPTIDPIPMGCLCLMVYRCVVWY